MDNESQDHAQKTVGDVIDRIIKWWFRPSRKDLQDRIDFLESENERITEKCAERGDENAALRAQLEALQMEIDSAKRAYQLVRRDVPGRIMDGKRADAVHEDRREYENNRLRVFVNAAHRAATDLLNSVAHLNKDLQRAKAAVAGGMLEEPMERQGGAPPGA